MLGRVATAKCVRLQPAINRCAVCDHEPYIVYQYGHEIESQLTLDRATKAVRILNEHEVKNGRPATVKMAYAPVY